MIGPGLPGATLEALADGFACGQVGTITVTIDDGEGNNVVGPTTANIVEIECSDDNAATYRYLGTYPVDVADSPYVITWEGENLGGTVVTASEEIVVSTDAPELAPSVGPCTDWITADDVADCCPGFEGGTDTAALEVWAGIAVEVLFIIAPRFTGLCGPVTVRPCASCGGCGAQQRWRYSDGSIGVIWTGQRWLWQGAPSCHCGCLPEVELGRYDVQGIAQVKIDGVVIAPSAYRLDNRWRLVRTDGLAWPACQNLTADDDEEGTFSVSYWYGDEPSDLAKRAAAELACQLWAACSDDDDAECELPERTRTVARAGLTVELGSLLAGSLREGSTGLVVLDTFIATYGGDAAAEASTVWSPDLPPAPRRVG